MYKKIPVIARISPSCLGRLIVLFRTHSEHINAVSGQTVETVAFKQIVLGVKDCFWSPERENIVFL